MEEQTLQPVPELIDDNSSAETEINTEAEVKKKQVRIDDDDEEFYERIEAPKFVDFTKPYKFLTDDRYWFCSRVGCDQKHEEEINHEEISKNFVLRVLAARSPNVKLRKALNREHASIKCPLSAPAKPSRPRMPRLATLISDKNGDQESKSGTCSKIGSTPVAKAKVKTRQVAAKYMTTPRNKVCRPDPSSFRSVQNPKATTVDVAKTRTVAKALVFRSPKKAIVLKKSVELHTPLRKICEGMKRLGITSQKKTLKGCVSKPKKPETEDSSRRMKICRSEKKLKDLAPSKSTRTPSKKAPTKLSTKEDLHPLETCDTSNLHVLRAEMNDVVNKEDKENMVGAEDHSNEVDVGFGSKPIDDGFTCELRKNEDLHPNETSDTSNLRTLQAEMNDMSNIEDKENMVSAEDHSNKVEVGCGSKPVDDGFTSELSKNENLHSNETSGTSLHTLRAEMNDMSNIEDKENMVSAEVVVGVGSEQIDDGKENASSPQDDNRSNNQQLGDKAINKEIHKKNKIVQTVGPGVMKCKKPKPTSIKPFRLRTDERGILKEAILEKKLHVPAPKKEVAKDTSVIKMPCRVPNTARRRPESTQQRSHSVVPPRKVRMPGQQLGVIDEKSSKFPSDVMVEGKANKSRAVSAARSTSRGKRPVTIAKEPNFHTSHLPRTCSKKIA